MVILNLRSIRSIHNLRLIDYEVSITTIIMSITTRDSYIRPHGNLGIISDIDDTS
jgi:hypothetical protein